MHSIRTIAILLATSGFAIGQSTSSTSCDAQNILEACLATTQVQVQACQPNEWQCLCDGYTSVQTCYGNCPGDPGKNGVDQQKIAYCNAAKSVSTISAGTNTATSVASAMTDTATSSTTTATETETATSTGDLEEATLDSAAALIVMPAGSFLAVLFGLVGML